MTDSWVVPVEMCGGNVCMKGLGETWDMAHGMSGTMGDWLNTNDRVKEMENLLKEQGVSIVGFSELNVDCENYTILAVPFAVLDSVPYYIASRYDSVQALVVMETNGDNVDLRVYFQPKTNGDKSWRANKTYTKKPPFPQ